MLVFLLCILLKKYVRTRVQIQINYIGMNTFRLCCSVGRMFFFFFQSALNTHRFLPRYVRIYLCIAQVYEHKLCFCMLCPYFIERKSPDKFGNFFFFFKLYRPA